jgi:L-lactate dehydrogenase complex protein LldG
MSARDEIFAAIRARRTIEAPRPSPLAARAIGDLPQAFAAAAALANAEVRFLATEDEVSDAVADLLRGRNLPAVVHVPPGSFRLPWQTGGNLTIETTVPGPEDATVALAPFGIAETGTLAYPSSSEAPASWHFRAGFEIAVVRADAILPDMENVLSAIARAGDLPSTVNFVTGPSRTGDIEQTLELGAHGPKALAILIVTG